MCSDEDSGRVINLLVSPPKRENLSGYRTAIGRASGEIQNFYFEHRRSKVYKFLYAETLR